jgi:type VI secretion system secreted protein Hcp
MALQGFIVVTGAKQGQFKGESTDPAQSGQIPIFGLQNNVSFPTDPATGAISGTIQHTPIVITKTWGAASPQFLQALFTNEVLTSVSMTFSQPAAAGKDETFFTINMVNAAVSGVRQYVGGVPALTDAANALEDISLTYQKIEFRDTIAQTSAVGGG